MPFTNTTHTSTSKTDPRPAGPSDSAASNSHAAYNPMMGQTYAGELYYGIGRFLRNQWDYLYGAFLKDGGVSPEAIARKQRDIYVAGLKECIQYLKPAIENVRKNPQDPASLGKVDDLVQHYGAYVNVHPTMEWHLYQQELFQPIREQIERFADSSLKRKLNMMLPVLEISPSNQEKQSASGVQEDEYNLSLVESYYDEKNQLSPPSLKEKRYVQQVSFPAVFNLSGLDGKNGFTVPGIISGGNLGFSVSMAGDINGDGINDLFLGAYAANSKVGTSYVIFGSQGEFPLSFDLSNLNGSNGFTIPGLLSNGWLGYSVSIGGDINGDNITDLILGAPDASANTGISYVIFGSRGNFPASFNLNKLNGTNGFSIPGVVSFGVLGNSVDSAGDINGDGIKDLVLGAYGTNSNAGTIYVIFGSRGGFPASFSLSSLNGGNGFFVVGSLTNGRLGTFFATEGDINGDNITDLVIGASTANSGNGVSYVIFGSRGGFPASFNLNNLNGINGFSLLGISPSGNLGVSGSIGGDINADGLNDLVLGAPAYTNSGNSAAYVIFGSRGGFGSSFNLNNLNGSNGFIIPGLAPGDNLGWSVSTAGDINGDGLNDLVLGSPIYKNSVAGVSYVIFGSREGFGSVFNLNNLNGTNGFKVLGIASNDNLGTSVSTAGDINGDGISDIVLGAAGANSGNGKIYVIFGRNTVLAPTPTPVSTPTPNPGPSSTTPISHNNVIIGLGVGGGLLVAALMTTAGCCFFKKCKQPDPAPNPNPNPYTLVPDDKPTPG